MSKEEKIDPYKLLVKKPDSTFFLQAEEDIPFLGINAGDLLVVDRQAEASDGKPMIANVDGELRVMKLVRRDGKTYLLGDGKEKEITGKEYVYIWGVVTWILRRT